MKVFATLAVLAVVAAPSANAAGVRDKLAGYNGVVFGASYAAAKKHLGAGVKAATDPSDPKVKILLDHDEFLGEKFSVNYTFANKGRFSALYGVAQLPAGDQGICQTRWVAVLAQLEDIFGVPDANLNQLSAQVPSQTITFQFADGGAIEAGLLGCLLTVNFLSAAAAK